MRLTALARRLVPDRPQVDPSRQPGSAGHTRIAHLPALDGLRGLALAGVLLFHADGALVGGYLGVDLFFVLSGYLITALLLAEQEQAGRIDLAAFWVRRARRLFPALLALMPAIVAYARWLAPPEELQTIRFDALATLGYVANWRAIFAERSYWDLFATPSPLEHTWSLAIEEQFYLLWPLIVVPILRRSRRALLIVTLLLAGLSIFAMIWLFDPAMTSRAYLGTDTRAAGILLGAAFAMVLRPGSVLSSKAVRRLDVVGAGAFALLAMAWWHLQGDNALLYHGGFWCTEVAVLALIACAVAGRRSKIARLLSVAPLRLLGKVSYGAYLWHWPVNLVLSAERVALPPVALHALRFAVTFGIAAISYRFLEQPIRKNGVPFGRPWLVVPAALGLIVLLIVSVPSATLLTAHAQTIHVRTAQTVVGAKRLLVVGDSTANALGWAVRGLHSPTLSVTLGGEDGFSLHNDGPKWKTWSTVVTEVKPNWTIVVLSGAFLYGMTADDGWRNACYPAWDRTFEAALTARLRDLKSTGARSWAATVPYPVGRYDKPEFRARVDCINTSLLKVVHAVGGIRILDLAEIQCPKGQCVHKFEGRTIRPDGVHYNLEAARAIALRTLELVR